MRKRIQDVGERGVRKTHHFLSEDDIVSLRPQVASGLKEISTLCLASDDEGTLHGFMGVDGTMIEMLFISPESRGHGLGRKMIDYAVSEFGAVYVDVNEQNRQGAGFYRHLGFRQYKRSALDNQGRPFPLLHLKLAREDDVPEGYTVGPATSEDIPLLNDIELASADLFPPGYITEQVRAERVPESILRNAVSLGMLWVAREPRTNKAIGYAMLCEEDGRALLAQVDVRPEHGRKGLGAALVRRVIWQAEVLGFPDLYLTTFSNVPWNEPFYRKLGFAVMDEAKAPAFIHHILHEERARGLENRVGMRLPLGAPPDRDTE